MDADREQRQAQESERWQLLRSLDRILDGPLIVLSFVWLGLLVFEFVAGSDTRLEVVFYAIWLVFIVEVAIELLIAPSRGGYLRNNWLKVAALLLPALRALRALNALRFLRAAAAIRSASLLRLLTTLNRSMRALSRTLDRTRFLYAVVLTVLVIIVGSAGLLFFEAPAAADPARPDGPARIATYGEALWWTAMAMTTLGAETTPVTAEGRLIGWLLSVYALGVFGYVTATMASHFLGLGEAPPGRAADDHLAQEVAGLRREIAALASQLEGGAGTPASTTSAAPTGEP